MIDGVGLMALMRLEGDEGSDESREEKERAREGGREGARGSCQEDLRLPSTDPDAAVFPNHSMCACMSVCARLRAHTHTLFQRLQKEIQPSQTEPRSGAKRKM